MRFPAILACALLACAPAAEAQAQKMVGNVRFQGGPVQTAQLANKDAVAFGDDGNPMFRGSQEFIRAQAGSQSGQVHEWDLSADRVRISPSGRPGLWLACADLKPMSIACAATLRTTAGGNLIVTNRAAAGDATKSFVEPGAPAGAPGGGGIPNCPGDPRCPRAN